MRAAAALSDAEELEYGGNEGRSRVDACSFSEWALSAPPTPRTTDLPLPSSASLQCK